LKIFILGPLQTTVKDFWRMIWQENISIIVMTTNIRESGTVKCFPYWPLETKEYFNTGLYQIQNEKYEKYDSFIITTLLLKKKNNSEIRTIYHAHYLKWPDHGVPVGTKDALLFLEKVEYYKQLTITKSPILLHCSAGIGRTGTFCAIDIGIKQYLNEKLIDIPSTVVQMRHERAGSVQTEEQYLFAYLALMDFIKQQQAIQERINHLEITNSKKSFKFNSTNTSPLINNSKRNHLQESTSQRVKILNDSSVSSVQHLISSINEPNQSQSSIEQISLISTTNSNEINRKIRK
jgi:protein-tyrosine phosphatase